MYANVVISDDPKNGSLQEKEWTDRIELELATTEYNRVLPSTMRYYEIM